MIRLAAIALMASLFVSNIAAAQDAKLIDAAKKEGGKIVAYGSLESNTVEPIIEAFNKKTGLTVEYWRASATKVMDRALAELRAGKPAFDVMVNNSGAIYVMKKEGVFAKYVSPAASAFPKDVIDPDLGPVYRNTPIGIVYNKGEIKPGDAPKSLEDLLSPKYKGKLVMPDPTQHTTTMQWLGSLYKIMGKEKADKFVRDLGATKPFLVESFSPSAERVVNRRDADRHQPRPIRCHLQRERSAGGLCEARQNVEHRPVSGAKQQSPATQWRQGIHRFFPRR